MHNVDANGGKMESNPLKTAAVFLKSLIFSVRLSRECNYLQRLE
jgi:hypothetical protein